MNTKQVAEQLNGSTYPLRPSSDFKQMLKENGLVIVYGASDDLMEFDGAIYDEIGCYDGGTAYIDNKGLLPERESIEEDADLEDYFSRKPNVKSIEAIWGDGDWTWQYKTEIPHETFEVIDDDENYCKGIVFSMADISS